MVNQTVVNFDWNAHMGLKGLNSLIFFIGIFKLEHEWMHNNKRCVFASICYAS